MWPLTLAVLIILAFGLLVSELGYWTGVAGRRLLRVWRDRMDNRAVGERAVLVMLFVLIGLGLTVLVRVLIMTPWGQGPEVLQQAPAGSIGQLAALFARALPVRRVLILTLLLGPLVVVGLVLLHRAAGRWVVGIAGMVADIAESLVISPVNRWLFGPVDRWLAGRRLPRQPR